MTEKRTHINELADRLDRTIPPGRSNATISADEPMANVALRLANAPDVTLPDSAKAQMLVTVLAAHKSQHGTIKSRRLTTTQTVLLITAALIVVTLVVTAIASSENSSKSVQDDAPPTATIPTTTLTNSATSTATSTSMATATPSNTVAATLGEGGGERDFDCEHPGNYCNSEGTPGSNQRGNGRPNGKPDKP